MLKQFKNKLFMVRTTGLKVCLLRLQFVDMKANQFVPSLQSQSCLQQKESPSLFPGHRHREPFCIFFCHKVSQTGCCPLLLHSGSKPVVAHKQLCSGIQTMKKNHVAL